MTDSKNKPVEQVRDGSLTVAIWANDSEHGIRYSVELTRSYKDKNDQWQTTGYLSNGEILRGSRLLALAYDQIVQLKAKS